MSRRMCWNRSCVMCAWYNESDDATWTNHASVVHGEMLCKGHHVLEITENAA